MTPSGNCHIKPFLNQNSLGEDGPTHQPIEMLESLRSMPNMHVYRPADGNEVL